jgi:hypothetical protein
MAEQKKKKKEHQKLSENTILTNLQHFQECVFLWVTKWLQMHAIALSGGWNELTLEARRRAVEGASGINRPVVDNDVPA